MMNTNLKQGILLGFLLIILFILNINKYTNKIKNIYGGEEDGEDGVDGEDGEYGEYGEGGEEGGEGGVDRDKNIKCSLEEIENNNKVDNKWVYNNGIIYNLTVIINSKYTEIGNIDINIKNIITYFKNTQEQDLSKMLKSIEKYNENIKLYNEKITLNKEKIKKPLLEFQYNKLGDGQIFDIEQKQEQFNKFKFIFIKSILQFERGIICPAGLIY